MEVDNVPEIQTFESRSDALISKLKLSDALPNKNKVIETSKTLVEKYKVPESFLDDDINLALVLGCGQKITESTDPLYRKRIENFIQRLVSPVAEEGVLDKDELWGVEPERGGLDESKIREYIESKVDPEATTQFLEKHKDEIDKAKEVWKTKGYDLSVNVKIVSDEIYEFRKKTRSAGFIIVPSEDELPKGGGVANIEFVLLKNYSDKDNFASHEIYHVIDYWGMVRRGYQKGILEGLDELHTEHAVGNYRPDHSEDPFGDSNYFTLKEFWDTLSYNGDIDFNLLNDRTKLLNTIASEFGLDGLVDFTLMHAHGDGKATIFETFYKESQRPIMDMLIAREKIKIRRLGKSGNFGDALAGVPEALSNLKRFSVSTEDWLPKNRSIYELLPTKQGKVYAASPVPESNGGTQIPNELAKNTVSGYATAIAFTELCYTGEIKDNSALYEETLTALSEIPHQRSRPDFIAEKHINKEYERGKSYANNDNELYKDIYSTLYYNLVSEMPGIDFVFELQNPKLREQFLNPFIKELDLLAEYCIQTQNNDFMKWFVDGLYRYQMTSELRDVSVNYLENTYPELKPLVEAKKASYDARKAINFSF